MRRLALMLLLAMPAAAPAFDAQGLRLGANEAQVKQVFPQAHCKALEWKSEAADRRCDQARIEFGGVPARITIYLRRDAVEAFDVRFERPHLDTVVAFLKNGYGRPDAEGVETIPRRGGATRDVYKVRWKKDGEQVVLTAQAERSNVQLTAWRGNFEDEIYRVR